MPRVTLTDTDLATESDYLRFLSRRRQITPADYKREMGKLQRKQVRINEREEALEASRRIAVRMAQEEAARRARHAVALARKREYMRRRREEARIVQEIQRVGAPVMRVEVPNIEDIFVVLVDLWKRLPTTPVRIVTTPAEQGGHIVDREYTKGSRDAFIQLFFQGSDNLLIDDGDLIQIFRPTTLPAVRLQQAFRDGIEHCVFNPILLRLVAAMKTTKSKDVARRYKQRIAKIKELAKLYKNGVPDDKMEEVAKACGYKIILHDILGKTLNTYNENGRVGVLKFTNTRPNHIEEGRVALDQDAEIVSPAELKSKWHQLQLDKDFYMIEGNLKEGVPRKIRTIDAVYELHDPNKEFFKEMDDAVGLNNCRFNATKHPEVNEFIRAGRIINSWVTPFSTDTPTGHLDMPKAYAQFKKCKWYTGFLGVVHQWRTGVFDRAFVAAHIGMYRFRVVKCENPLFKKLGLGGSHILPSCEVLYFLDNGVEMVIDAGVWGARIDFEFSEDMLQDRRYCLWSGRLGMERPTKSYTFKCSRDWASHLKAEYGDDCFYWEKEGLCSIRVSIGSVFTTHHIFAFITSYVRIQMMEAMKKFKVENLVKVVMDGVYFKGEQPAGLEWFAKKPLKKHGGGFGWYDFKEIGCIEERDLSFAGVGNVVGNTLLTGQGGCGKTFSVMTDTCFNRILFVTPQHILGADVREKYGVPYTTIHKLIGEECTPYKEDHAYPPVIFVDEITQIESSWIEKVFTMYPLSLIILAGDVNAAGQWFQCRNGKPGEFSTVWKPANITVVEIAGDMRSRDDELRELKLRVRSIMTKVFIDGDQGEDVLMRIWGKKRLPTVPYREAYGMFRDGDVWIAGTHKTSARLMDHGVVSGWYKKGGFVAFEEVEGYDKRGSFTIHSFQGRTLATGKIFISVDDLFEYAMLYTAISRAVSFNQLVFVSDF